MRITRSIEGGTEDIYLWKPYSRLELTKEERIFIYSYNRSLKFYQRLNPNWDALCLSVLDYFRNTRYCSFFTEIYRSNHEIISFCFDDNRGRLKFFSSLSQNTSYYYFSTACDCVFWMNDEVYMVSLINASLVEWVLQIRYTSKTACSLQVQHQSVAIPSDYFQIIKHYVYQLLWCYVHWFWSTFLKFSFLLATLWLKDQDFSAKLFLVSGLYWVSHWDCLDRFIFLIFCISLISIHSLLLPNVFRHRGHILVERSLLYLIASQCNVISLPCVQVLI